jgi:hypothetical protein
MNSDEIARDELKAEYLQMRTNILHNETLILQTLGGIVSITVLLMGYALTSDQLTENMRPALFIIAEGIAFLGLFQTIYRLRGTYGIASYLRVFIEPYTTHLKWESRLRYFRVNEGRFRVNHNLSTYQILIVVNALLAVVYLLTPMASDTAQAASITIAIVTGLLLALAFKLNRDFTSKSGYQFDPRWRKADEHLRQQSSE